MTAQPFPELVWNKMLKLIIVRMYLPHKYSVIFSGFFSGNMWKRRSHTFSSQTLFIHLNPCKSHILYGFYMDLRMCNAIPNLKCEKSTGHIAFAYFLMTDFVSLMVAC